MKKFRLSFIFIGLLLVCGDAHAHSGRTDRYGGHYNRKTGGYHYHNSGSSGSTYFRPRFQPRLTIKQQAILNARADAFLYVDSSLWYLVGACPCILPIVSSSMTIPQPPPERLLGKSPEYVKYYTTEYQAEVENHRTKYSSMGCAMSTVGILFFMIIYHSAQED